MDNQEIRKALSEIFQKVFKSGEIQITDSLTADQVKGWDSLSHLSMIADVESFFGIKFKLKELVSMKNVGELIQLIQSKTG
ncbi:MAG: acyl carrier protein [Bacteroidetes bacterium]|nr:acyl carrier protein [Bacteroidota bacterium]